MLRSLINLTFVYVPREDRIAAAINAGGPDAWSCWLTRRLALAVLERTADYLASRSDLAQRTPADFRGEAIAFERDAAIAKTQGAMSVTPPETLQSSMAAAELAERLTISPQGKGFRLELRGQGEEGGQIRRHATAHPLGHPAVEHADESRRLHRREGAEVGVGAIAAERHGRLGRR